MTRRKADLSIVKVRDGLPPLSGSNAYWHKLRPGCWVGYRPSTNPKAAGRWAAKAYVPNAEPPDSKEPTTSFGSFAADENGNIIPPAERFALAKVAAETWAAHKQSGGRSSREVVTVADACRKYAEEHPDANHFFKRIYEDPAFGGIKLAKLKHDDLADWVKALKKRPAQIGRKKRKGENATRPRAPASINREMTPLRAALNQHKKLIISQDWAAALTKVKNADRSRNVDIPREDRRALLAAMLDTSEPEIEPLARALTLLPVRPGAMAALDVASFNLRTMELIVGLDKGHAPRKLQVTVAVAELFARQMKGKLPSAPMFMRGNGKRWDADSWKHPIKEAVIAAKVDPRICAYAFRHAVITDLVSGGMDIAEVAHYAGTSIEYIQKNYWHHRPGAVHAALDKLAM